jgi:hypothetical protein
MTTLVNTNTQPYQESERLLMLKAKAEKRSYSKIIEVLS